MKTLFINGSPRKNGECSQMIDYLKDRLGEVQILRSYDGDVQACVDCRYCFDHPTCAFQDFRILKEAIEWADNIILVSPVYFGELTGSLLSYLSKIQVYWSARYLRKDPLLKPDKKGALILAYAGHCQEEIPLKTAQNHLSNMGVGTFLGLVAARDTDHTPALKDSSVRRKLDELVLSFTAEE